MAGTENYLIIGAGAAGLAAAVTLRRFDQNSQVTILSREKTNPYSRILLPYLLADIIEEKDIYLPIPEGSKFLTGQEVVEIDTHRRKVITSTGEVFSFDKLLISGGSSAVTPEIKGSSLSFVFTLHDLGDIQKMRKWIKPGKRALISGGGLVSVKCGEALSQLGMKVTFVIGSDRVLSRNLDLPAAKMVEQILAEKKIETLKRDEIIKIEERSFGGGALLQSGIRRECELVVFGKGVRPNTAFLTDSDIEMRRGIVVDEHQETNVEGIYAAGDVAETADSICGERRINALWRTAREQGRIAALNMACFPISYDGSVAINAQKVFTLPIFTAGMGKEESPEVLREQGSNFYHKLVIDKGILKGAIFIGKMKNEGLYQVLLTKKIDVSAFKLLLLRNTISYPHIHKSVFRKLQYKKRLI